MSSNLAELQPYQKLRVIDDKLYIDERKMGWVQRKLTGDNRWKVLEVIKELLEGDLDSYLEHVINILVNTTYKSDRVWVEEMQAHNPYKKAEYSEFTQLNYL